MLFNADEAFEMAEQIESNAIDFYTKAADIHSRPAEVELLRRLAEAERNHRDVFVEMRRELPVAARQLPDEYPYLKATLFLNSLAGTLGGEGLLSNADPLVPDQPLEGIIRKALRLEETAILFYIGLRDAVPANRGRDKVDLVIAEEKEHLAMLAGELARLVGTEG